VVPWLSKICRSQQFIKKKKKVSKEIYAKFFCWSLLEKDGESKSIAEHSIEMSTVKHLQSDESFNTIPVESTEKSPSNERSVLLPDNVQFWKKKRFIISIISGVLIVCLIIILVIILPTLHSNQDDTHKHIFDPLLIQTETGPIQGFYFNLTNYWNNNHTTVRAWRGIPFASPPVDELRWMSPQPPESWTSPLSCTEFRSPCVQPDGSGNEDCLYLNVYTSLLSDERDTGLWPVYVDLYGGGLLSGANTANFSGLIYANVAERSNSGLVVVAPAYRVNLFGFLSTESLTEEQNGTSGNYGTQDQLLALRWVQDNIQAFNGDPNNVIVGGLSSGGTSVFGLLSSEQSNGLFHAAFSMSGSTNLTMDLATAESQNIVTVNASGCNSPGFSYVQINNCLRNLTTQQVVDLIPQSWNIPGIWGLPLGATGQHYEGVIIVDGKIITQSFSEALASGLVDVPFLFGNMGMEPDQSPDNYVWNYSQEQWYQFLNQTFLSWGIDGINITNKFYYDLYYNDSLANPQKAYDRIVADYGLYCSQITLSTQALPPLGKRKSNIYLYYDGK
jgi:carboxylesterase type B